MRHAGNLAGSGVGVQVAPVLVDDDNCIRRRAENPGQNRYAEQFRAEADELVSTRNAQLSTFVLSLVVLDAIFTIAFQAAGL